MSHRPSRVAASAKENVAPSQQPAPGPAQAKLASFNTTAAINPPKPRLAPRRLSPRLSLSNSKPVEIVVVVETPTSDADAAPDASSASVRQQTSARAIPTPSPSVSPPRRARTTQRQRRLSAPTPRLSPALSSWTPARPSTLRRNPKSLVPTPSRTLDEVPSPDSDGEDPLLLKGTPSTSTPNSRRANERSPSLDDTFNFTAAARRRGQLVDAHADDRAASGSDQPHSDQEQDQSGGHDDFGGHEEFVWGPDELTGGGFASDSSGDEQPQPQRERERERERDKRSSSAPYREHTRDYEVPLAPITSSPARAPAVQRRSASVSPKLEDDAADVEALSAAPVVDKPTPAAPTNANGADELPSDPIPSPPRLASLQPDDAGDDSESEPEDSLVLVGTVVTLPRRRSSLSSSPSLAAASSSPPRSQHATQDTAMTSPGPELSQRTERDDVRMESPSPRRLAPAPEDAVMGSPSPARRPPPTSIDRLRSAGGVEKTREMLEDRLPLLFRQPAPAPAPAPAREEPVASTSRVLFSATKRAPFGPTTQTPRVPAPAPAPAPTASTPQTLAPSPHPSSSSSQPATQTPHSRRSVSTSSTARRPRPSHPTLPVIEISSADPKAAARAAALLTTHGEYIQYGRQGELQDDLLRREERRVSRAFGSRSESASPLLTATPTSSVLGTVGGSSPGESPVPTNTALPWGKADWHRLEGVFVEVSRATPDEAAAAVEDVVDEFLMHEGLEREDCAGDWDWDKLVARVTALQKTRAKSALERSTRRSARKGDSSLPPSLDDELRRASEPAPSASHERTSSLASHVESTHSSFDEDEQAESEREDESESDSGSERDAMEDTFYLRLSAARARPASPTPSEDEEEFVAHPPPALANAARFAHLYDDPIAKPPLPPSARAPSAEPSHSGDDFSTRDLDRSRSNSATPELSIASLTPAPSPARRVLNYLGSLVGRSASSEPTPAPGPPPPPPPPPQPEMTQIPYHRLLTTPRFASTDRPYPRPPLPPPRTTEREIRKLPTTTPRAHYDRRRRSGGEGGKVWDKITALEDAESSREEDQRLIALLQSGGGGAGAGKRPAASPHRDEPPRKKTYPSYVVYGTPVRMVPSGTRALDGPIAGGAKSSKK